MNLFSEKVICVFMNSVTLIECNKHQLRLHKTNWRQAVNIMQKVAP